MKTDTNVDLLAITQEAFLDFGVTSTADDVKNAMQNTSIEQAQQFIQREYQNQSAQIVSECGYRICTIASQGGSLAAAGLANICSAAFRFSGSQPEQSALQAQPSTIPYIFGRNQTASIFNAFISYGGPGSVNVTVPTNTDLISVDSLFRNFTLNHDQGRTIKFHLKRPSAEACIVSQEMPFRVTNDVNTLAIFSLSLVHDGSCLQPVSVSCGSVDPHLSVTAYSDQPSGQGFDPKKDAKNVWLAVPSGDTPGLASAYQEYLNNGGGNANAWLESSCSVLEAQSSSVRFLIQLKTHLQAQSGHCCGGSQPGGDAEGGPEWKTTITLPGDPINQKWNLQLTSTIVPTSACTVEVDGNPPISTTLISPGPAQTSKWPPLSSGSHQLSAKCSSISISARPGNWDAVSKYDETITMSINVSRQDRVAR